MDAVSYEGSQGIMHESLKEEKTEFKTRISQLKFFNGQTSS